MGGRISAALKPLYEFLSHRLRPPRPARVDVREVGSELQQVIRLHGTLRRLFPDLRLGDERDDGKRLDVRVLEFGAQAVLQPNSRQGVREALGFVAVIVGKSVSRGARPRSRPLPGSPTAR